MVWSRRGLHGSGLRHRCARDSLNRIGLKESETKGAGGVPFDKKWNDGAAIGNYRLSAALGLTMRDGPPPSSALEQRLHESA
jgi:hypothetical protein